MNEEQILETKKVNQYCMILQPTDNGIPTIFNANQAACKNVQWEPGGHRLLLRYITWWRCQYACHPYGRGSERRSSILWCGTIP